MPRFRTTDSGLKRTPANLIRQRTPDDAGAEILTVEQAVHKGALPPKARNTVAPVVSGSVGLGGQVTCTIGTWEIVGAYRVHYQWRRNGVAIIGSILNAYTIVNADLGQAISCEVTIEHLSGAVSVSSNSVSPAATASNLVTAHVSYTSASGTVSASGEYGGNPAWAAFDGIGGSLGAGGSSPNTWVSNGEWPAWIEYAFNQNRTVTQYKIRGGTSYREYSIHTWELQGWNGSSWVTLDSVVNYNGFDNDVDYTRNLASPGAYMRYRLYVTGAFGNNYARIPEITLMGY